MPAAIGDSRPDPGDLDVMGHPLHVQVRGSVPPKLIPQVTAAVQQILSHAPGPVHFVAVTLSVDEDLTLRYSAEAHIDVDIAGYPIHAHAAAPTIIEAADFVLHQLRARVTRAGTDRRVPYGRVR